MTREELLKAIEKAKKGVRQMNKSGQTDTVHHQNLARFEAELAGHEFKPKKGKELNNG